MVNELVSAVINWLLTIPPVRYVMGLVDSRWRPLWAALWIAVIVYILSRAMNQWALRRARLRILAEQPDGRPPTRPDHRDASAPLVQPLEHEGVEGSAVASEQPASRAGRDEGVVRPGATGGRLSVPLPVVAGALVVGALAVAGVAVATRPAPNDSAAAAPAVGADSVPRPDAPIDIRYRSGRMEGDHCVGTFEITHGRGTRARLVAFVMDTSGAVIGRDSATVASAVTGIFVDFRFRYVECDEIDDWQIQATTPTARQ